MKIYHTETQEDYDALMVELEEQGYKWISGDEPSQVNAWKVHKNQIGILMDNGTITHSSLDYFRSEYPSLAEASRKDSISISYLSQIINGDRPQKDDCTWTFAAPAKEVAE